MNIEEKSWSKTLLTCYGHLETICGAIDKTVLNCGISSATSYCDAEYIAERMIALTERKKFLINLKVLIDRAFSKINSNLARVLVLKFIDGVDSETSSKVLGICPRTFFRQVNSAVEDFWHALSFMGYSSERFKQMFKEETWIIEIFNSYCKKQIKDSDIKDLSFLTLAFKQLKQKSYHVV